MVVVAHIHTQFPEKFGIPRQSGLVPSALGNVVMEPEYRNPDAFKGIEEFSHLWLLWEFSKAKQDGFHRRGLVERNAEVCLQQDRLFARIRSDSRA